MSKQEIQLLVVVAGALRVGLPIVYVRESMRPLKIELMRDPLPFVLGLSVIRGEVTPVVDLGAFLSGRNQATFHRFVTLNVDGRTVALAVDEVESVLTLNDTSFSALPPLLVHTAGDSIARLSLADAHLLLMLEMTKLIPESWVRDSATGDEVIAS